jgi:uncharacterized protein
MPSIFRSNDPRRLGAAMLAGALALAGIAWASRAAAPDSLPADPLQLEVLASAGRQDAALARLKALADGGSPLARRALGLALIARGTQVQDGLGYLQQAADGGDVEAGFQLGKLYRSGAPGVPPDAVQALRHFTGAARAGHAGAAYYLGIAWRNGYGVAPDAGEAVRWFRASAQGGVAAARFMLANAYREGNGVAPNDAEAVRLYTEAAEQEHPEAIQTLAMAYMNGELGLPRDSEQARHYLMETAHALKHPAQTP